MSKLPQDEKDTSQNKLPDLPSPTPFHITEPHQERGLWCFWLTADNDVLRFVRNLNCIMTPSYNGSRFGRTLTGRAMFAFNPRYDHEETWAWLHEVLQSETAQVELDDNWETAIRDAHNVGSNKA